MTYILLDQPDLLYLYTCRLILAFAYYIPEHGSVSFVLNMIYFDSWLLMVWLTDGWINRHVHIYIFVLFISIDVYQVYILLYPHSRLFRLCYIIFLCPMRVELFLSIIYYMQSHTFVRRNRSSLSCSFYYAPFRSLTRISAWKFPTRTYSCTSDRAGIHGANKRHTNTSFFFPNVWLRSTNASSRKKSSHACRSRLWITLLKLWLYL